MVLSILRFPVDSSKHKIIYAFLSHFRIVLQVKILLSVKIIYAILSLCLLMNCNPSLAHYCVRLINSGCFERGGGQSRDIDFLAINGILYLAVFYFLAAFIKLMIGTLGRVPKGGIELRALTLSCICSNFI